MGVSFLSHFPLPTDMALFEISNDTLTPISEATFAKLGLLERANIQRALRSHINTVTPGIETMVLAEEFGDWEGANRRIDLLCLDENARLVVVEIKRDSGAHMELQAIRYAAMISTMLFDQAVEAHRKYLRAIGSDEDAEQAIREFLGQEVGPVALSDTVRIVLASATFPQELTTAVLWLNEQGLDIRCVQMRPHVFDGRILLDVNQVIPLPEAEQYQVAVREKSVEQDIVRASSRDTTRYDLYIGDASYLKLPKGRLIYEMVAAAIRRGMPVQSIKDAILGKPNLCFAADGLLSQADLKAVIGKNADRYFTSDADLFRIDGRTYALSNQWGGQPTLDAVDSLCKAMPGGEDISYEPAAAAASVEFGDFVIRRLASGTIEVDKDGVSVEPVMPVLRTLAAELNVSLRSSTGTDLNTQNLGVRVMAAIRGM